MTGAVFVEGSRVTLRTLEESDLEFLHGGVNHPEVRRLLGQPQPTSRNRERAYFEEADADHDHVGAVVWDGEDRVGVVEFDPVDRETGVAELAVWIHPDHQRQGYAREAVALFVGYAFSELRMHKVTANAFATNEGSRRLLESLGFVEEGVGREDAFFDGAYRDTHYYGVLESEWEPPTP